VDILHSFLGSRWTFHKTISRETSTSISIHCSICTIRPVYALTLIPFAVSIAPIFSITLGAFTTSFCCMSSARYIVNSVTSLCVTVYDFSTISRAVPASIPWFVTSSVSVFHSPTTAPTATTPAPIITPVTNHRTTSCVTIFRF